MTADTTNAQDVARRIGEREGQAAGSWVIDGNTTAETIRAIAQGLDDGDPAILDALPLAPPFDVFGYALEEIGQEIGAEIDPEDTAGTDALLSAFAEGWNDGATAEIERMIAAQLAD